MLGRPRTGNWFFTSISPDGPTLGLGIPIDLVQNIGSVVIYVCNAWADFTTIAASILTGSLVIMDTARVRVIDTLVEATLDTNKELANSKQIYWISPVAGLGYPIAPGYSLCFKPSGIGSLQNLAATAVYGS